MSKRVVVKFLDGPKEVGVGDTVYCVSNQHRVSSRELKIDKVGKKYITCGRQQFEIESGREKTEYCGSSIYSSKEGYEAEVRKQRYWWAFRRVVQYKMSEGTTEQLVEAAKVLGLEEELHKEASDGI